MSWISTAAEEAEAEKQHRQHLPCRRRGSGSRWQGQGRGLQCSEAGLRSRSCPPLPRRTPRYSCPTRRNSSEQRLPREIFRCGQVGISRHRPRRCWPLQPLPQSPSRRRKWWEGRTGEIPLGGQFGANNRLSSQWQSLPLLPRTSSRHGIRAATDSR